MTTFDFMQRLVGIRELAGAQHHPVIQWGFMLCDGYGAETPDEVPWCSAILQVPTHILRLPRTNSAWARSWLEIGIETTSPAVGNDIVVLSRGTGPQGHVGCFAGIDPLGRVLVLGGNQANQVSVQPFLRERVLAFKRLS